MELEYIQVSKTCDLRVMAVQIRPLAPKLGGCMDWWVIVGVFVLIIVLEIWIAKINKDYDKGDK